MKNIAKNILLKEIEIKLNHGQSSQEINELLFIETQILQGEKLTHNEVKKVLGTTNPKALIRILGENILA